MSVLIDAATEYISIADNAKWTWIPVSQVRTLSYWWRSSSLPNAEGEYQVILLLDQSGGNKAQFSLAYTGGALLLLCGIFNSSWTNIGVFYTPFSPSLNTWYYIVFVASTSGNCKIYVNTAAQSVTHTSWDDTTEINPTAINISNGAAVYDNFQIAHFAVFNDELTSTEVTNIRNRPYSFDANANIICSIHMDEETGTNANDVQATSTQTDGTLTNGPTWADQPEEFTDHFTDQNARWAWEYYSGTGYQECPVDIDDLGNTVCEIGITDETSSSTYSDGNLHEDDEYHDELDCVEWRLKTSGITQGTYGWGMWEGDSVNKDAIFFWWADDNSDAELRGFRATVIVNNVIVFNELLSGIDTTIWHTYRIERGATFIQFLIDEFVVAFYEAAIVPLAQRLEAWVDNAYYVSGVRYLETIDHYQKIYIDWCNYIIPAVLHFNYAGTGTDGINFSEIVSAQLSKISNPSDYILYSDTAIAKLGLQSQGLDGLVFADSATGKLVKLSSVVDGLVFSDIANNTVQKLSNSIDGLIFSDIASSTMQRKPNIADGLVFSDIASAIIQARSSGQDTIIFGDSATGITGTEVTGIGADGLIFSELVSVIINRQAIAIDSIKFSDVAVWQSDIIGIISVTFISKRPVCVFTDKKPEGAFISRKPEINFN